jgi:hypothetical protein
MKYLILVFLSLSSTSLYAKFDAKLDLTCSQVFEELRAKEKALKKLQSFNSANPGKKAPKEIEKSLEDKSNFILELAKNYDEGFKQIAVIKPDLENKGMAYHLRNKCKDRNYKDFKLSELLIESATAKQISERDRAVFFLDLCTKKRDECEAKISSNVGRDVIKDIKDIEDVNKAIKNGQSGLGNGQKE